MKKRTNTAFWVEKESRWCIAVQKNGTRKRFYSSTPGRTGQREANAKADAWLDDSIRDGRKKVATLYAEWVEEVAAMRVRIREMRELLVEKLAERGVNQDFSFIREQNGMFSFSGLSKDQVERLKSEFAIYIVGSGRISVAGITRANIDPLCDAIAKVL